MKSVITFTDTVGIDKAFTPKPASEFIPDWYKKMESYIAGKKEIFAEGTPSQTIKRCMPVFDSLTAGYIITTFTDIYVRQENDAPYFSWPSLPSIGFHAVAQLDQYPNRGEFPAPKWINPWAIKVPKGYSVLFTVPMHQPNEFFKVLPGIVDCDEYVAPVNFPFLLNDERFEGLIPAGTPIVQVIPFKREKWKMNTGGNLEIQEINTVSAKLKTKFFDSYKTFFRNEKEYK
jgi:hypothetical protein